MSFGYSVGDVILLAQLAWRTLQGTSKACGDHDELTREVSSLYEALKKLSDEIKNPDSLFNRQDNAQLQEFQEIGNSCKQILSVLDSTLTKYNALAEDERSKKKLWQFENKEVRDLLQIRLKLSTYTSAILMISLASQGRIEKQLNNNGGEMRQENYFSTHFKKFEPRDAVQSAVDIVFVSGLASHLQPQGSTWGSPRFFWPQELGRSLPNARILVWEVAQEKGVDTEDHISHLSVGLLKDLVKQRGTSESPLIFVAHSLGGLIVKSALLKAEKSPLEYPSTIFLTKGICFFGTPQAWGRETWRHAISAVRKVLAARAVDSIQNTQITVYADESDAMRGESKMFRRIVNRLSLPILTFYETETTPTNRGKALIVGEDTAQLRTVNEQVVARHANHMNIAKFYNAMDRDYRRVRDFVTMIVPASALEGQRSFTMGKTTVPSIQESDSAAVESSLLHALRFDWLQEDMIADCDPKTCDWMLNNDAWKRWLSQYNKPLPQSDELLFQSNEELPQSNRPLSQSNEPLWIFGAPGMGKTVLSKFILQELRARHPQEPATTLKHTIGYFFDGRVTARRSLNGLIRALLHHFLLLDSELFRSIRGKYVATSPSLTNTYLLEILITILEDPRLGQVTLIIEGLDECSAAIEPGMVGFISSLKSNANIRLIVTARPEMKIKNAYLPRFSIDLDSDAASPTSSIKLYVKAEVQRVLGVSGFPEDFQQEVENVLLSRPSPNFLWVRLAVRYIELQRTTLLSRKAIKELPTGAKVDPLFKRYLRTEFLFDKIPLPSVYIVMEAKAPMTVLGLSFLSAATFHEQSSLINRPDVKISTIEESVIRDFEHEIENFPFLQVRDSAVSLMHSSLREILVDNFSADNGFNTQNGRSALAQRLLGPAGEGVKPFLAAINYFIAELSLTYLLASLHENQDPLDFLRYSTLHWFEHIQAAAEHASKLKSKVKVPATLLRLIESLLCLDKNCNDWPKRAGAQCSVFTKWIRQYKKYGNAEQRILPREDSTDTTAFTLAAFDLYNVLGDDLIKEATYQLLVVKDKAGHTPLHLVVSNNSLASLKWIQDRLSADSSFQKFHSLAFQTSEKDPERLENCPVYLAAEYGNKEMVELFANSMTSAPPRSRQRLGRLLHSIAAKNRHTDIFLLLYKRGFLDLPSEDQQAIAESAAILDCVAEVGEILLKSGDVVSRIEILHCAIRTSAERTVDYLLLLPQVDVNKLATSGRTALHEAADVGNDKIVAKLFEKGATVNAVDKVRHQTPLHLASQGGFSTVCVALLEKGARVNLVDEDGSLPVHHAAKNGHDKALELLVKKGTNLFAADKNGCGPLHLACQGAHASTVQLLLSMNARVAARDRRGRTSLHYAASSGNKTIVWMLVDAGADVSVQDDDDIAPIHLAAQGSSDVMIIELLRLGADSTVKDSSGKSVYVHCLASDKPSRAVFQVLMEHKVPISAQELSMWRNSLFGEWVEEFQSSVGGLDLSLSTASTDDLLRDQGATSYVPTLRVGSPEDMYRDLRETLNGD